MQQLFANPFAMYAETQDRIANNRMNEQRNAMAKEQWGFQKQEFEAEAEARRKAKELEAIRAKAAAFALGGAMPAQAQRPMVQGAPIPQAQPMGQSIAPAPMPQAAPLMEGGREVDRVTVTGMKDRAPSQVDVLARQMQYFVDNGRQDLAMEIYPKFLEAKEAAKKLSEAEEQKGYDLAAKTLEKFAAWAVNAKPQIAQIPMKPGWENQVNAMVQELAADLNRQGLDGQYILERARIDPGETPQSIARDLDRMIAQLGGSDAIKSRFNTRTENAGGSLLTLTDSGDLIRRDDVTLDPTDVFKERQANARNAADNITSRENSIRTANRPIFDDGLFGGTSGQNSNVGQPGQPGPWDAYRTRPAQGQR